MNIDLLESQFHALEEPEGTITTVAPQILVKFTSSVGGLAVRIGLTENSKPD